MTLIFGLSKRTSSWNLLSRFIEFAENRPFSHCYVRFQEPSGIEVVFQASGLAVNLVSFADFCSIETPVQEYQIEVSPEQGITMWQYVLNKLGTPYSVMQLFRIFIYKLTGLELGDDGQSEVCSELVTQLCQFLGIENAAVDADYTDPAAFQAFCIKNMKRTL
jgi:hypothetical protein